MEALNYLKDRDFLRALDNESNKFYWVKIEVLDKYENSIQNIEGRVQPGSSVSLSGDSSVRRTCNITFIAEDAENDLTNIDNLLSANKKIKIFEGVKNNIDSRYSDIIWFPLGVYVITQPSISHNSGGCTISLSCKDKMCLLNGECAGGLPTSVTFDSYDQIIGSQFCEGDPARVIAKPNDYTIYSYYSDGVLKYKSWNHELGWIDEEDDSSVGETISVPQRFYDIIQTLVCNYGGESLDKIFINDIPLEIKQIVRYTGGDTLYYNTATNFYTLDSSYLTGENTWRSFEFNEDVGYVYTDFTYPGSLVSGIGDNVCSVLDNIKAALGNYEYFYDINGNFVFQEIRNYLNTSYDPVDKYRLDNGQNTDPETGRKIELAPNGLAILNGSNYQVDFYSNTKSVYTFNEGSGLIISTNNNPDYTNIKNDFHIWGENAEGYAIHYHLAIKEKPLVMNTYSVVFKQEDGEYTGGLRLAEDGETGVSYTPDDWRAELYLQGLEKQKMQIRPDIYEQELLDLFDIIYDFREKKFKTEIVECPNDLNYFFDYIEPTKQIYDCSVDCLGSKVYSMQESKIKRLYNTDVPNTIMISLGMDAETREKLKDRCRNEGQPFSNVNENIYSDITVGTWGYTAEENMRDLLYNYTNYNESISLQSIPIYYLDVNSRITVQDQKAGIYGDYIIKSISLPLSAESAMSITAVKALERI